MSFDTANILRFHAGDKAKAIAALKKGIQDMQEEISPEKTAVRWNLYLREAIRKNHLAIQELEKID